MMRISLRWQDAAKLPQRAVLEIPAEATLADLRKQVVACCGAGEFKLKVGYPPKLLSGKRTDSLSSCGIKGSTQIIVVKVYPRAGGSQAAQESASLHVDQEDQASISAREDSDAALAARLQAEWNQPSASPQLDADALLAARLQAEELKPSPEYAAASASDEPAAKRPRYAGGGAPWSRRWMPFRLLSVDGVGRCNDGAVTLRELVGAGALHPRWVVVCNYLIDPSYLFGIWPELVVCERVIIFSGKPKRTQMPGNIEWIHLDPTADTSPVGRKIPYGVHHSKMFLLGCDTGVRVIIHTANLLQSDLEMKSQTAYAQDFPLKTSPSTSNFEGGLVQYFKTYGFNTRSQWPGSSGTPRTLCEQIAFYDYQAAFGEIVASAPGYHETSSQNKWGYPRLRSLVRESARCVAQTHASAGRGGGALVVQCSSLGSLTEKWLKAISTAWDTAQSTAAVRNMHFVWPTVEEIRTSVQGYAAGGGIPGPQKNVEKSFLSEHFCKWSSTSDTLGRTAYAPHMKTYLQLDPQSENVAWILISSHNLSKAAWGELQREERFLFVRHWEIGVFFSPRLLAAKPGSDFSLERKASNVKLPNTVTRMRAIGQGGTTSADDESTVLLPVPFDLPPVRYKTEDHPWIWDRQYAIPDRFGRHGLR